MRGGMTLNHIETFVIVMLENHSFNLRKRSNEHGPRCLSSTFCKVVTAKVGPQSFVAGSGLGWLCIRAP